MKIGIDNDVARHCVLTTADTKLKFVIVSLQDVPADANPAFDGTSTWGQY